MYPQPDKKEESRRKIRELAETMLNDAGLNPDDGTGEMEIRKGATRYVKNSGNKRFGRQ